MKFLRIEFPVEQERHGSDRHRYMVTQLDLCLFLVSGNEKQSKLNEQCLAEWESWEYHAKHRKYFKEIYKKFFLDLVQTPGNKDEAPHLEERKEVQSCVLCSIIPTACACGLNENEACISWSHCARVVAALCAVEAVRGCKHV